MTTTSGRRVSSTRERFREQMREDVKELALAQLVAGGAQAISLNAIAKDLNLSGSALYRYYANRDDLLNGLVIDAYTDLRDAIAADAVSSSGNGTSTERVRGLAGAYRGWARQYPHRYELLFKPPLPGYDAHAPELAEAARTLMGVLLGVLTGRIGSNDSETSLSNDEVVIARVDSAKEFQYALRAWSRVHGLVSLEIGGSYNAMGVDADALFEHEVLVLSQ